MNIKNKERKDYYDCFQICTVSGKESLYSKEFERFRSALASAQDIRKFEIDLYWKRTQYFWAFLTVIYGGYFYSLKEFDKMPWISFVIAAMAVLFSFSWVFVNRGSKFWQNNWEHHVDLLEDIVHGPLYKTIVFDVPAKNSILTAAPYSVSKINQTLSWFVASISVGLFLQELPRNGYFKIFDGLSIILFGVAITIYHFCRLLLRSKSSIAEEYYRQYNKPENKGKTVIIQRKVDGEEKA